MVRGLGRCELVSDRDGPGLSVWAGVITGAGEAETPDDGSLGERDAAAHP